jgi:hypothetical protein
MADDAPTLAEDVDPRLSLPRLHPDGDALGGVAG